MEDILQWASFWIYVKPLGTYDIIWEKQLKRFLIVFVWIPELSTLYHKNNTCRKTWKTRNKTKTQMMKSLSCPRLGANSVVVVAFGWMSATKAAMRETAAWLGNKKTGWWFHIFISIWWWFSLVSFFFNLTLLGGGFMFIWLLLLFGEDSHFDYYFWIGLRPPIRKHQAMELFEGVWW